MAAPPIGGGARAWALHPLTLTHPHSRSRSPTHTHAPPPANHPGSDSLAGDRLGVELPEELPPNEYYDYYAPGTRARAALCARVEGGRAPPGPHPPHAPPPHTQTHPTAPHKQWATR